MLPPHSSGRDPWLKVRRLRGRPPVLVSAEAGEAFSASLEQAEAYHRASVSAGPAVSPTLLYYSLVQFGKAMHFAAGGSTGSLPTQHGLGGVRKKQVVDPPLGPFPARMRDARGDLPAGIAIPDKPPIEKRIFEWAIVGHTGRTSTLSEVQRYLGEDELHFTTSLGRIVAGHPDLGDLFVDLRENRPIAIREVPQEDGQVRRLGSHGLIIEIVYGPEELKYDKLAERLAEYAFPEGWEPIRQLHGLRAGDRSYVHYIQWIPQPITRDDEPGIVDYTGSITNYGQIAWLAPDGIERDDLGYHIVSPNSPTGNRWSRLIWWWVLLHALGDVARYHPAEWAEAIDLRRSPIAADLIELLDRAIRFMPELGYWAIKSGQESQRVPPVEHARL